MTLPADDLWREPIQRLFELINLHDLDTAEHQAEAFWDQVEGVDDPEAGLIWTLRDVIDGVSGYCVGWRDPAAFVETLEAICEQHSVTLDWGDDDPNDEDVLEHSTVPALMAQAHAALQEEGVTLWNWDTQGDAYAGWMTRSVDDAEMESLAEVLGLALRPADQPY